MKLSKYWSIQREEKSIEFCQLWWMILDMKYGFYFMLALAFILAYVIVERAAYSMLWIPLVPVACLLILHLLLLLFEYLPPTSMSYRNMVRIDEKGVSQRRKGKADKFIPWEEVTRIERIGRRVNNSLLVFRRGKEFILFYNGKEIEEFIAEIYPPFKTRLIIIRTAADRRRVNKMQ